VVRLRFQRFGRRHRPFYRLAALDRRTRRNGTAIEYLGWYDPIARDEEKRLELNEDRIKYWLSVGAQPSETVRDILAKRELVDTSRWEADRKRRRDLIDARKTAADAEAEAASKADESEPDGEAGSGGSES